MEDKEEGKDRARKLEAVGRERKALGVQAQVRSQPRGGFRTKQSIKIQEELRERNTQDSPYKHQQEHHFIIVAC